MPGDLEYAIKHFTLLVLLTGAARLPIFDGRLPVRAIVLEWLIVLEWS